MAAALECPACGARTPLHALPNADTFRCGRCGQALKVPPSRHSSPGASAGRRASAASAAAAGRSPTPPAPRRSAAPVPPAATPRSPGPPAPPRRRGAPATTAAGTTATAAVVSATIDPRADADRADRGARGGRDGGRGAKAARPVAPAPDGAATRAKVAWYWRLVAWVVAVPLGLLLTGWPAYRFKGLRKDDLLDVFVGTGTGRYTRLAAFTLVWALVTALLVQLFVEGGRWLARRRRARAAVGSAPVAAAPAAPRPGRPPASARR